MKMKLTYRALLVAAMALSLSPGHALAPPKDFQLLVRPHVAMLCALEMVNLAIEAQRNPTGSAFEAVDHSGKFFALALTWLPDAAGVTLPEQERLARFVAESPFQDLITHGTYCGEEASSRLNSMPPAERAESQARGMQQAAVLARVVGSGG